MDGTGNFFIAVTAPLAPSAEAYGNNEQVSDVFRHNFSWNILKKWKGIIFVKNWKNGQALEVNPLAAGGFFFGPIHFLYI